jgi:hypothetical protein
MNAFARIGIGSLRKTVFVEKNGKRVQYSIDYQSFYDYYSFYG